MPTRDRATSIMMCCSAPYEKSKSLGSGGSMVARLKLKEIDGRAPPGVNITDIALSSQKITKSIDCLGCLLQSLLPKTDFFNLEK